MLGQPGCVAIKPGRARHWTVSGGWAIEADRALNAHHVLLLWNIPVQNAVVKLVHFVHFSRGERFIPDRYLHHCPIRAIRCKPHISLPVARFSRGSILAVGKQRASSRVFAAHDQPVRRFYRRNRSAAPTCCSVARYARGGTAVSMPPIAEYISTRRILPDQYLAGIRIRVSSDTAQRESLRDGIGTKIDGIGTTVAGGRLIIAHLGA